MNSAAPEAVERKLITADFIKYTSLSTVIVLVVVSIAVILVPDSILAVLTSLAVRNWPTARLVTLSKTIVLGLLYPPHEPVTTV